MGLNQIKVELLTTWQGTAGGDGTIAHAAWASSTDKEKLAAKTDEDIRRIATNVVTMHHDTPKERLWMEFFITCPIFVERQFDKYRMTVQYQDFQVDFLQRPMGGDHITQNELSGRYRTIPERPYKMPHDVDLICAKAVGTNYGDDIVSWATQFEEQQVVAHNEYKIRLAVLKRAEKDGKITNAEYKRAREVLRGALGTATLTDMRIVMNLNAFEHIVNQRLAPEAQLDSRVVAYWMVVQLLQDKVAPAAVIKMVEVNKWSVWLDEVAEGLYKELLVEDDVAKISPEDSLWIAIMEQSKEFDSMERDEIRVYLLAGGFPINVINQYLYSRGPQLVSKS